MDKAQQEFATAFLDRLDRIAKAAEESVRQQSFQLEQLARIERRLADGHDSSPPGRQSHGRPHSPKVAQQ